ncbi:MAG: hypothetical protein AB1744_01590, partial [Candidatus Zixiibacteriota bacterium]
AHPRTPGLNIRKARAAAMKHLSAFVLTATVCFVLSMPSVAETVPACEFDKSIKNCKGKYVAFATVVVPRTGVSVDTPTPECSQKLDSASIAEQLVNAYKAYKGDPRAAGDLIKWGERELTKWSGDRRGFLAELIVRNGAKTKFGNCASLFVVVPVGAKVVGKRITYTDNFYGGPQKCKAGKDCGPGWAKFTHDPVQAKGSEFIYYTEFMNWKHNLDRTATLAIMYEGAAPIEDF